MSASASPAVLRFLDAFLQERNIKWILGVGTAILLGSSVMLVAESWHESNAYVKQAIMLGYTSLCFLVGALAKGRLGLPRTGQVLYVLVVLLIPVVVTGLHWVVSGLGPGAPPETTGGSASLMLPLGLLGLTILFAIGATRRIFRDWLGGRQLGFQAAYLALTVAGALGPGLNWKVVGPLALACWGIYALGAALGTRRCFWMVREGRTPGVAAYWPTFLLGVQFFGLWVVWFQPSIDMQWSGFGLTLLSLPILGTSLGLARVRDLELGLLARRLPTDLALPLLLGVVLVWTGVFFAWIDLAPIGELGAAAFASLVAGLVAVRLAVFARSGAMAWMSFLALGLMSIALWRGPVLFELMEWGQSKLRVYGTTAQAWMAVSTWAWLPLLVSLLFMERWWRTSATRPLGAAARQAAIAATVGLWLTSWSGLDRAFAPATLCALVVTAMVAGRLKCLWMWILACLSWFLFLVTDAATFEGLGNILDGLQTVTLLAAGMGLAALGVGRLMLRRPGQNEESVAVVGWRWFAMFNAILASLFLTPCAMIPDGPFVASLVATTLLWILASNSFGSARMAVVGVGLTNLWVAIAVQAACSDSNSHAALGGAMVLPLLSALALLQVVVAWGLQRMPSRVGWVRASRTLRYGSAPLVLFTGLCNATALVQYAFSGSSAEVAIESALVTAGCVLGVLAFRAFRDRDDRALTLGALVALQTAWSASLSRYCLGGTDGGDPMIGVVVISVLAALGLGFKLRTMRGSTGTVLDFPVGALLAQLGILGVWGLAGATLNLSGVNEITALCASLCAASLAWAFRPGRWALVASLALLLQCLSLAAWGLAQVLPYEGYAPPFGHIVITPLTIAMAALCPAIGGWFMPRRSEEGIAVEHLLAGVAVALALFTRAAVGAVSVQPESLHDWVATGASLAALAVVALRRFRLAYTRIDYLELLAGLGILSIGVLWAASLGGAQLAPLVTVRILIGVCLAAFTLQRWTERDLRRLPLTRVWQTTVRIALLATLGLVLAYRQSGDLVEFEPWTNLGLLAIGAMAFARFMGRRATEDLLVAAGLVNFCWVLAMLDLGRGDLHFYGFPLGATVIALCSALRSRLSEVQLHAGYWTGALLILASPALDIVKGSWAHMLILLCASTLLILVAIGMRVKALLYAGAAFLGMDLLSMVVHGSIEESTVLWVCGVLLGGATLSLGAIAEHRRTLIEDRIRSLSHRVAAWE